MNQPATRPAMAPAASAVLTDLAQAINQAPGVQDVQALVVEKSVAALAGTAGSVMLPGDHPGAMRVMAAIGPARNGVAPPESPVAEWVVRRDEPVLLIGRSGPLAHLLQRDDIRDAVCVPLRYAGSPIGALSVSNSRGRPPFGPEDVELLTAIGHLAAVALKNTMLYEDACGHREQIQAVLKQLWSAEESERKRLAEDLHDGPAQALFHIAFQLQAARNQARTAPDAVEESLEKTERVARDTLAQIRAIMAGLRPMSLDDLGLVPALRSECAAINNRGQIRAEVDVIGDPMRLHADLENGLFRMAREALSNAERHSGADRVKLQVVFGSNDLSLSVSDEGRGFSGVTACAARRGGRIGLAALRERAGALGIALSVQSEEGQGTQVSMRCPWRTLP